MPTTWRHWTEQEDCRLEDMVLAGRNRADIAQALGRTLCAVGDRCVRLGIVRPRIRSLAWIDQLSTGRHPSECARRLGCAPQTGRHEKCRLSRLGLLPHLGRTQPVYPGRACIDCGATFAPANSNKKRCHGCQLAWRRLGRLRWPCRAKRSGEVE